MSFNSDFTLLPYTLSPLFPELEYLLTAPSTDQENHPSKPLSNSRDKKKKIEPADDGIDHERTKHLQSLFPLVPSERIRNKKKHFAAKYEKKENCSKIQEVKLHMTEINNEYKLLMEQQRRNDFLNKLARNGINVPAMPV